eukprot:1488921-Pleurochrysis_carterae.AAC.1
MERRTYHPHPMHNRSHPASPRRARSQRASTESLLPSYKHVVHRTSYLHLEPPRAPRFAVTLEPKVLARPNVPT